MRMLDLFAGTGGASQVMRERGWQVVSVELEPHHRPDIVADVRALPIRGHFDLLWASPPCTEFSRESMPWCRTGVAPTLDLWNATRRAIEELSPTWWIIENVRGAITHVGPHTFRYGSFYLWTNLPLTPQIVGRPKQKLRVWGGNPNSAELRARVPRHLSEIIADLIPGLRR